MTKAVTIILAVLLAILVIAGVILYPEYTGQKQALQSCEKKLADLEKKAPSEAQLKSAQEALVSSLNEQIKKQEITIKELAGGLSLSMVDRILFKLGEATLTPQGEKVLAKVGAGLGAIGRPGVHRGSLLSG
jgi:flagellar motor protein MotB